MASTSYRISCYVLWAVWKSNCFSLRILFSERYLKKYKHYMFKQCRKTCKNLYWSWDTSILSQVSNCHDDKYRARHHRSLILVCNLSVKSLHLSYKLGTPLPFLRFLDIFPVVKKALEYVSQGWRIRQKFLFTSFKETLLQSFHTLFHIERAQIFQKGATSRPFEAT